MNYKELLKHPNWQRMRLKVLERDDFTCRECKSTSDTLHVHHLSYEYGKDPWDYPLENFITLCHLCHEREESFKQEAILKAFASAGQMSIVNLMKIISVITFLRIKDRDTYNELREFLLVKSTPHREGCEKYLNAIVNGKKPEL
jgi:hypothetical protein